MYNTEKDSSFVCVCVYIYIYIYISQKNLEEIY